MKTPAIVSALFPLVALASAFGAAAAGGRGGPSDIVPLEKRKPVVEAAARLARPVNSAPLAGGIKSPFEFEGEDPAPGQTGARAEGQRSPGSAKSSREILDAIANDIRGRGTSQIAGSWRIQFGTPPRWFRVGDKLIAKYEGADYEVEITSIGLRTYTLSYKGESTTRATQ